MVGFDAYMERLLKDWNAPGIGVGIVVGDKLVFAKGYGYRDYEKKLPFTPETLFQIASNTKLFTAVAAGMLVDEGKLTWDKPVHDSVPTIRFYNDDLTDHVTLHDMLSHRTGITRHDLIWYKSDFDQAELFSRLQYLEPQEPLRQTFIYNNLMFSAAGYMIQLQSGKTWQDFVRERILTPLGMNATVFSVADMVRNPDHGVPFQEKPDSFELYRAPFYEDTAGVAPAGGIISNIDDLSHWLIALMNAGKYNGNQVLPADVLTATIQPSIPLPNSSGAALGYWELLDANYGMGRFTASYRGKLLTYHGGDLRGFHSQVSFLPNDGIGVIVAVIGDQAAATPDIVSYNVYERLLGMSQTPWSQRLLERRLANKKADTQTRSKYGVDRVPNTVASHPLTAYTGEFTNPAFGSVTIDLKGNQLQFNFHHFHFPLERYHYDRFDTFYDAEDDLKFSLNFRTNSEGDIDSFVNDSWSTESVFTRKPETLDPKMLAQLAGVYIEPDKVRLQVVYEPASGLSLVYPPGAPPRPLTPVKGLQFTTPTSHAVVFEFVMMNGRVTALKIRNAYGEQVDPRE